MAFNAKNLHYEKQEPAFLRRLKGENNYDRLQVSIARPRNPRLETRDDDDGPTIVDEQGKSVTEQEYLDLLDNNPRSDIGPKNESSNSGLDANPDHQLPLPEAIDNEAGKQGILHVVEVSGPKKRKPVKVVAAEPDSDPEAESNKQENKPKTKPKKKKVKLSFDDPDT